MAKKIQKPVKKTTAAAKPKVETKKVETKKVDIVEEAKKELKKMEATGKTAPAKKSTFPWGVFCGTVLLTLVVAFLGWKAYEAYIVNQLVGKLPAIIEQLGGGMEVEGIGTPKNVGGVYQFTIKFKDITEEFTSSITADGKQFFVEAINVEELLGAATAAPTESVSAASCESLTKTENPQLVVYVSSDCSYCKQAETEITTAIAETPVLADQIKLRYAGSLGTDGSIISFLGSPEAGQENLRQVCLREEQHPVFWSYVGCMAAGGTSDSCLSTAGANTANLTACMTDETRGPAAIKADMDQATAHAIQGTPSFYVNDSEMVSDIDFGGRVPEAYRQIICCASSTQPDFCTATATTE